MEGDKIKEEVAQESKYSLEAVIRSIPKTLYEGVYKMDTEEEKRMMLYAITVMTGALMPNVWINYNNQKQYPGLMLLVSYPAGAGKGKLALLSKLLSRITNEMKNQNAKAMSEYRKALKIYERAIRNDQSIGHQPEKPTQKLLLIPGNITSSKLTEQLAENDGTMMVLLFETEADAYSDMAGTSFGNGSSVILRKAYQHETISQMRKLNGEHFEINCPKMAVVFSGTHSQIPHLFKTTEDGLYSRFLIVRGSASVIWKDVKPCDGCIPLDTHFEKLSEEYYKIYHFLKNRNIEIKFSDQQWQKINESGGIRLVETQEEGGEDATSIAKRHANMIVRIASIFTVIRYFENYDNEKKDESELYCNDIDFENAYWMVEESYQSSLDLFKTLAGIPVEDKTKESQFFELLPDSFIVKELAPLKKELKLSDRTITRWLSKLVSTGELESFKKGSYKKLKVADVAEKSDVAEN